MLKQRMLTAIILIPIVILAILFLPPLGFATLLLVFLMGATWEWTSLIKLHHPAQKIIYLIAMSALFVLSGFFPHFIILWIALFIWIIAAYFVMNYQKFIPLWEKQKWLHYLGGLFILLPCWVALILIRQQSHYFLLIMILLLMIWSTDTCGYFVGRRFGKSKLLPQVSPGKTKAGTWGALLLTAIFTAIVAAFSVHHLSAWLGWILLSVFTSAASVFGDLVESMIKRQAGVKDSGTLLPGHGGILDRIDSLTAAAPIFVLGFLVMQAAGIV